MVLIFTLCSQCEINENVIETSTSGMFHSECTYDRFALTVRETSFINRNRYRIFVKVVNSPFYVYIGPISYHVSLIRYVL